MQAYFKCLFAALADCHDFGIMHRDVKPANFLFNINTNTGTLCDFGLAQRYHPSEWQGRCLHSQPVLWANQFEEIYTLPKSAIVHGEKLSRPIDTLTQLSNQKELYDKLNRECLVEVYGEREGPKNITKVYATDGYSTVFVPAARFEREMKRKIEKDQWDERWMPVRRPLSTMKVGYMKPEFDKRCDPASSFSREIFQPKADLLLLSTMTCSDQLSEQIALVQEAFEHLKSFSSVQTKQWVC